MLCFSPFKTELDGFSTDFQYDASRDRDWDIAAHWMLYVDNYLEGFHIPFVHPELNDALANGGYATECFEHGVLQIGLAAEGEVCFDLQKIHPTTGRTSPLTIGGFIQT